MLIPSAPVDAGAVTEKNRFFIGSSPCGACIRGEESRKDAAFVKTLCQDHGIRCHIFSVGVPLFAEKHGLGLEEAARILRYDCYKKAAESVKKEFPEKKIRLALAHHAEDNAETVLFQMVRGSGLDGLCGMSAAGMRGFTN